MIKVVAALLCAIGLAGQAAAQEPTITIVGTGTVKAIPDLAVVMVGIETEADTAREAQARNAEAAAQTILALREGGISAGDIRTQSFTISPVYSDRRNAEDGVPRVRGYRVTNRIEATIRDISGVGGLLDAVVVGGANRIDSLRFGLSNESRLLDDARRQAVAEAKRRAELFADATGVILGPIQSLSEGHGSEPGPMQMAEVRAATPILPGSLEVQATVRITWAIYAQ